MASEGALRAATKLFYTFEELHAIDIPRAAEIIDRCMAAPSPSVPSGPVERTLDDADTDAALKAVESMLPPAGEPERSATCPTCKSTDPKVRLKGLAWAANLYPERGCVIRCEDRTCRSVVPHFHAYCSNSFHLVSDDPGKGDVR